MNKEKKVPKEMYWNLTILSVLLVFFYLFIWSGVVGHEYGSLFHFILFLIFNIPVIILILHIISKIKLKEVGRDGIKEEKSLFYMSIAPLIVGSFFFSILLLLFLSIFSVSSFSYSNLISYSSLDSLMRIIMVLGSPFLLILLGILLIIYGNKFKEKKESSKDLIIKQLKLLIVMYFPILLVLFGQAKMFNHFWYLSDLYLLIASFFILIGIFLAYHLITYITKYLRPPKYNPCFIFLFVFTFMLTFPIIDYEVGELLTYFVENDGSGYLTGDGVSIILLLPIYLIAKFTILLLMLGWLFNKFEKTKKKHAKIIAFFIIIQIIALNIALLASFDPTGSSLFESFNPSGTVSNPKGVVVLFYSEEVVVEPPLPCLKVTNYFGRNVFNKIAIQGCFNDTSLGGVAYGANSKSKIRVMNSSNRYSHLVIADLTYKGGNNVMANFSKDRLIPSKDAKDTIIYINESNNHTLSVPLEFEKPGGEIPSTAIVNAHLYLIYIEKTDYALIWLVGISPTILLILILVVMEFTSKFSQRKDEKVNFKKLKI